MKQFSLDGTWSLKAQGTKPTYPALVPGSVHQDLLNANVITDPYYRDDELDVQWIGEKTWTYSRDFELTDDMFTGDQLLLVCQGLDTLAKIKINGKLIAQTDNQFRSWEFDVAKVVKPGKNTIEITFDSPLPYMTKQQKKRHLNAPLNAPHEPHGRGHIRKSGCNFGWDWGPVLITCGINQPIYLLRVDTARLSNVAIDQDHSKRNGVALDILMELDKPGRGALQAHLTVRLEDKVIAESQLPIRSKHTTAQLTVKHPQLWWPNGMGAQPLYHVTVELCDAQGNLIDVFTKRIGLRTLTLRQEKDKYGQSFEFVVNGIPFFAKGANWIPADAIVSRLGYEDYAYLLESAAEAHMNMIRIWGGGIYESDMFYDICDELGICVWQDFMFACSTYRTYDKDFMTNVEAEATQQVKRLRDHACLALWCGNNELEMFAVGPRWTEQQMSWSDYGKLFDKLLPKIVKKRSPAVPYWPSSPHTPGAKRTDFNNPDSGDAHLWNVWHGKQPFEWYHTCTHRFNSEFGFQSFPEPRTVADYTQPQDRNITSYVMEHHQRSGIGNSTIMLYMTEWFRMPGDFNYTLWLSQILQGMAMKYACEHWRRAMPRGMGTLYWQLNDCWPVASWASIDYYGRWKALHYMAKRFFAPLLISGVEDPKTGKVAVHVTSDLLKAQHGTIHWKLTTVDGKTLDQGSSKVAIAARKNKCVKRLNYADFLKKHDKRDLMIWLSLDVAGQTVSDNFLSFARPKHMELTKPTVKTVIRKGPHDSFIVKLSSPKPVLWAWLELKKIDAQFSDNFVHLPPGQEKEIMVFPGQAITLAELKKQLNVQSLVNTYK